MHPKFRLILLCHKFLHVCNTQSCCVFWTFFAKSLQKEYAKFIIINSFYKDKIAFYLGQN